MLSWLFFLPSGIGPVLTTINFHGFWVYKFPNRLSHKPLCSCTQRWALVKEGFRGLQGSKGEHWQKRYRAHFILIFQHKSRFLCCWWWGAEVNFGQAKEVSCRLEVQRQATDKDCRVELWTELQRWIMGVSFLEEGKVFNERFLLGGEGQHTVQRSVFSWIWRKAIFG